MIQVFTFSEIVKVLNKPFLIFQRKVEKNDYLIKNVTKRIVPLEFKAVAIPFMSDTLFPLKWLLDKAVDEADREDTEARLKALLHVAATRAKGFLRVSWSGQSSKFIQV